MTNVYKLQRQNKVNKKKYKKHKTLQGEATGMECAERHDLVRFADNLYNLGNNIYIKKK